MSKRPTMKEINEIRKRNMAKWTPEDYKMYGDFLDAIFGSKKSDEVTEDDESSEEEFLHFKEWMASLEESRRGNDGDDGDRLNGNGKNGSGKK